MQRVLQAADAIDLYRHGVTHPGPRGLRVHADEQQVARRQRHELADIGDELGHAAAQIGGVAALAQLAILRLNAWTGVSLLPVAGWGSFAHMVAPAGWTEPFQTPDFQEFTVVLRGTVTVECDDVVLECHAGQTLITMPGERIRYGVGSEGAEYLAICIPAFTPDSVHREAE